MLNRYALWYVKQLEGPERINTLTSLTLEAVSFSDAIKNFIDLTELSEDYLLRIVCL